MPPPDRVLRRMVADLAALHADDIAAVLDQLDPPERRAVEHLLHELSDFGFGAPSSRPVERAPAVDLSRFSPWLAQRLEGSDRQMTAHARTRLRDCALRLYPLAASAQAPERDRVPGFLGRFRSGGAA